MVPVPTSRRPVLWACLILSCVSCGTNPLQPPAGKQLTDFASFKEFRFWRTGTTQTFCLPSDSIYTASISVTQDGRYRLSMSIAQETASAFGTLINCDPDTGRCNVELKLTPRDLTAAEIEHMKQLFGAIGVGAGGIGGCGSSCLSNHLSWDQAQFQATDSPATACATDSGAIDPTDVSTVMSFLADLRRNTP